MSYSRSLSEYPAIAIDNGSSTCRMGIAGDEAPSCEFPSYVGRPQYKSRDTFYSAATNIDEFYIGSRAQESREILSLTYPVQRGIVTNWDDMEKIWQYGFSEELKINPTERPVITSEPPLNPRSNSEKMAQVMFETFAIPALKIGYEPDHILFATGRGSGIVVNIGHGVSFAAAIYEGANPIAQIRSDFGGIDITNKLQQLLFKRGLTFSSSVEFNELERMKKELCYVARDQFISGDKQYKLPDGSLIKLDSELYEVPELLFNPDGIFNSGLSIPSLINSCLLECCIDTRLDMCVNFLISGGTSHMNGFNERLQSELKKLMPNSVRVKVVAYPDRQYSSWIGKSIYGSLSCFSQAVVSKEEYEEYGPCSLHGKVGKVLV